VALFDMKLLFPLRLRMVLLRKLFEYANPTRSVGTISVMYNVSDFAHVKANC